MNPRSNPLPVPKFILLLLLLLLLLLFHHRHRYLLPTILPSCLSPGLWAIYATRDSAGKMVISKIDHKKMEIERSWMTSYPKKQLGNAFMICGVLYATNSHKDTPTFIRYIYNTETNKEQTLVKGELPFSNSALLGVNDGTQKPVDQEPANCVMLSYDYRTSALYSWNNKRVESFPVYFKTRK